MQLNCDLTLVFIRKRSDERRALRGALACIHAVVAGQRHSVHWHAALVALQQLLRQTHLHPWPTSQSCSTAVLPVVLAEPIEQQ